MSDSTQPGSDDRPGSVPVPPAPPAPPVPPAPPAATQPPATQAPTAPQAPSSYAADVPPAPPAYGAPAYGSPAGAVPPGYAYAPAPAAPPRTLSLIGMILGIAGLAITIFAWGFGFILSAPAVVLGFLGRRREPAARGFALTAIITGFAGIAVSLIYLAITIVIFAVALGAAGSSSGY
ncbi:MULTISPECIES: DUF4190 domain-containing protein [unclassified Rathayibacter]|uniref:DUF4190 domain-containing protein n=1 Tax=unclassified Rathayibacter TaxID=2609250 RepID=UPI0006F44369|nr:MULTISPECIES: DUF4190 domain-containing protein [unclassified Rathayibacter]KQQ05193.1 hypothetical protein ASF42_00810 [Rathayibacter sp. Leaf294]KQS13056.1 hypothetical protein ASG06_00810 [Rathayibacter sp. Leaf185]